MVHFRYLMYFCTRKRVIVYNGNDKDYIIVHITLLG